jgi:hypothetical protein
MKSAALLLTVLVAGNCVRQVAPDCHLAPGWEASGPSASSPPKISTTTRMARRTAT